MPSNPEDPAKRAVYQLLSKEQSFAVNLQFGVNRFLLPLSERKDFINASQHHTLFQNIEEVGKSLVEKEPLILVIANWTQLLRISEDIVEQAVQEDIDSPASFLGRIYLRRVRTSYLVSAIFNAPFRFPPCRLHTEGIARALNARIAFWLRNQRTLISLGFAQSHQSLNGNQTSQPFSTSH